MGTEQKNNRLDPKSQQIRNRWRRGLSPFIREQVINTQTSGLSNAIEHMRQGGSLILFSRHRSRVDPVAIMMTLYDSSDVIRDAPIAYPIGKHQEKLLGINISNALSKAGITINSIVTEGALKGWRAKIDKGGPLSRLGPVRTPEAVKKYMKSQLPKENTGFIKFAESATYALENGGVVYLPTQSERAPLLRDVQQGERTLGNMAALVKRRSIPNVGILFVDATTSNGDKHPEKKGGLDIGRINHVRFGEFFTFEDALRLSGGDIKGLDAWAVRKIMAKLVSPQHLSDELRTRIIR